MLVGAAPIDVVDRVSSEMPSAGRSELSALGEVTEGDVDASLQPSFDSLITDLSKSLMPCPEEPMDPLFGPGPVCQPQQDVHVARGGQNPVKEENFEWVSGAEGINFFGVLDEKGVSNVHDPVSVFFILNSHLSPESQFTFVPMSGYKDQFCNITEDTLMAVLLRDRGADPATRLFLTQVFGTKAIACKWCHYDPGDIVRKLFFGSNNSSYKKGIGSVFSALILDAADTATFNSLQQAIDQATCVDDQFKRNVEQIKALTQKGLKTADAYKAMLVPGRRHILTGTIQTDCFEIRPLA
ncbi:hypothetical protein BGZ70_003626, partial [Mortierella alpina]